MTLRMTVASMRKLCARLKMIYESNVVAGCCWCEEQVVSGDGSCHVSVELDPHIKVGMMSTS